MNRAPTKADSLSDRMNYTFGQKRINRSFQNMMSSGDLIDYLTDDARDELLSRCIASHKLSRKFAAESRAHYRAKMKVKCHE